MGRKGRTKMGKFSFSLILFLLSGIALIFLLNREIEPNIDSVSRLKAKGIVNEIISETIYETFSDMEEESDLFLITKEKDGTIQMVQANTILMNRKISQLTVSLQKKYEQLQPEKVRIPIGSVFGSALLSQTSGGLDIRVLPLSVSKCDYVTGFESQGINQTKYRIFVEIESCVRVLQPFSQENFEIITKMPLSEVVIIGDVPESYVVVPKEDILDVT